MFSKRVRYSPDRKARAIVLWGRGQPSGGDDGRPSIVDGGRPSGRDGLRRGTFCHATESTQRTRQGRPPLGTPNSGGIPLEHRLGFCLASRTPATCQPKTLQPQWLQGVLRAVRKPFCESLFGILMQNNNAKDDANKNLRSRAASRCRPVTRPSPPPPTGLGRSIRRSRIPSSRFCTPRTCRRG